MENRVLRENFELLFKILKYTAQLCFLYIFWPMKLKKFWRRFWGLIFLYITTWHDFNYDRELGVDNLNMEENKAKIFGLKLKNIKNIVDRYYSSSRITLKKLKNKDKKIN